MAQPYLTPTRDGDLVTTSLNELGRLKFTDLMSDYQNTVMLKRTMKKNKMDFDSGPEVQFNAIVDDNKSAKFVGLYNVDGPISVNNVMITGKVDWRFITWNWAYDLREPVMNSGSSKIVDLLQTRRIAAFGAAILAFERAGWSVPAATDELSPFGIPYWVVKSNTPATQANNDGFNGTAPAGYSLVGGIDPVRFPRWANYATQYSAITKDDLIRKLRRAFFKTDWKPLVDTIPTYNTGDDYGIYCNYDTVAAIEEILESQNENLGTDAASMDGKAMIRRTPLSPIHALDADLTNPCYLINWGEFKTMGQTGWWMKETVIPRLESQHTVGRTDTDCTYNHFCRNRRRNAVVATDTAMYTPA